MYGEFNHILYGDYVVVLRYRAGYIVYADIDAQALRFERHLYEERLLLHLVERGVVCLINFIRLVLFGYDYIPFRRYVYRHQRRRFIP